MSPDQTGAHVQAPSTRKRGQRNSAKAFELLPENVGFQSLSLRRQLRSQTKFPYRFKGAPKFVRRNEAHSSISVRKGQPRNSVNQTNHLRVSHLIGFELAAAPSQLDRRRSITTGADGADGKSGCPNW
jgi:hypothetical protein